MQHLLKYENWQTNGCSRGNVGVSCWLSSRVSNGAGGVARVSDWDLNNSSTDVWTRQRPLLLFQNLIEGKHPPYSLHICFSLIVWSGVLTSRTVGDSKPGSQLRDYRGSLLSFRFLALRAALLTNFNKIVQREFLITGVQHFEVVFGIVRTNLRCCHNVFRLGGKPLKSGDWCR